MGVGVRTDINIKRMEEVNDRSHLYSFLFSLFLMAACMVVFICTQGNRQKLFV